VPWFLIGPNRPARIETSGPRLRPVYERANEIGIDDRCSTDAARIVHDEPFVKQDRGDVLIDESVMTELVCERSLIRESSDHIAG
jgi:L-2-hydroxyglutarate oxidase LhgO